jgi:signal transduction histidine kinase
VAWPGTRDGAAEIAVYAAACLVLALWGLAVRWPGRGDRWPGVRARGRLLLLCALGIITVAGGAASTLPGGNNLIVLSILALAAMAEISPLAGWIVTAAGAVVIESAGLRPGMSTWTTIGYPVALLLGLLLGLNRCNHRVQAEQARALAARSDELREEQARAAALDERARIAREIHDVLAHSLGALGLQIELAEAVLTDTGDQERAAGILHQAHRMAADGLAETRRAVHALRGQTPPLPEGLAELSAEHQRRHGAQVTFEVTGEPRALPPDAGLALTRTAREALVNAAKHAPRQPVQVRLDYAGSGTSVMVTSHLASGSPADGPEPALVTVNGGYGLTGMRERLLLLDGTLSAGRNGGDWVVEARVPG